MVFSNDDGEDGTGVVFAEKRNVFKKFFAERFSFGGADQVESGEGSVCEGWGRSGGVDEGAGAVDDEGYPIAGGGEVSTGKAEGFAERAHLEMDSFLEPELFCESHAGGAEDSKGVGFIKEELGAVQFAQI